MTEAEWNNSTEPLEMLEALHVSGRATERKLRLLACGSCRRIWHLLKDERSKRAVELVERYADKAATTTEEDYAIGGLVYEAIRGKARSAIARSAIFDFAAVATGAYAANYTTNRHPAGVMTYVLDATQDLSVSNDLCSLIRDIIGDPFRQSPPVPPGVLAWNGGIISKLAQAAYENRQLPSGHLEPSRLSVLADALEEAGVTDADLLQHLRGPGPHVRGCWVVDLLLGKQ